MAEDSPERLAALSRVLMSLIRGTCHELNNPLTGILGYVQLLLADPPEDLELRQDLEHIDECARRIEDMVNLLSRSAARERSGDGACLLSEVVSDVMSAWVYSLNRQGITLERDLPGGDVRLAGPERDVRLILSLLLEDLVSRMPEGGVATLSAVMEDSAVQIRLSGLCELPGPGLQVAASLAEQQGGQLRPLATGVELRLRQKDSVPTGGN